MRLLQGQIFFHALVLLIIIVLTRVVIYARDLYVREISDIEKTEWTRERVLADIRRDGSTVLLSFSRGKDSLTAWCYLLDQGFTVVPFFMDLCPGLQFVEKSLRYYEDFFGTHIYRCIHPGFYRWLRTLGYQFPHQAKDLQYLNLPHFDFEAIQRGVARTAGLPETTWTAVGTRIVDSLNRRLIFKQHGPINHKARRFSPIYDMQKEELVGTLQRHRVKLPIDYTIWGRSFDGLDYRYIAPLKEAMPEEYARIKEWFPLIELEFQRAEIARRHGYAL